MRIPTLLLPLCLILTAARAAERPNIVLFYADDLAWTDLGVQGSGYYESPRIDSLAREGMTFTRAYAGAANCAPSRACLLTGLYSPRHGVYTVGSSARGRSRDRKLVPIENSKHLDPSFETISETLNEAGYATCVAGKWHVSEDPADFGFDANFGGCHWGHPKSYFAPYHNPALEDGPDGEHLPARLASEVSGWIRKQKDDPFFVYLPFYSVHTPIEAPEQLTRRFADKPEGEHHDHAKYAAMIKSMDDAVGTVLDTLDELDLADDTLVIFTSDNGPHGAFSNARPLRGSKGMFYEGGIREPFFVRWPGHVEPGSRCHTPIHQIDLFPTLARIAGAQAPERLDGVDLGPLFAEEAIEKRDLFWHFPAYLQGDGRNNAGSRSENFRTTPCSVIMRGPWKLIEYFEDGALELYHLGRDPSEATDLSDTEPRRRDALHAALKAWREATQAPVPTEPNPNFRDS